MNANNLAKKIVTLSFFVLLVMLTLPLLATPPSLEPVYVQIVNSEPVKVHVNPKTSAYALLVSDSSSDRASNVASDGNFNDFFAKSRFVPVPNFYVEGGQV